MTHKPLHAAPGEREAAPPHRYLGAEVRSRLRAAPAAHALELVVSGHVHQHRDLTAGGVRHLWAPSAWAALPERVQATVGTKRCGAVLVHLGDDGTVDARLLQPEGLDQHVIGDTVPDPYAARR